MKWFNPEEALPPENKYVLIHVPNRPWLDSDDPDGFRFYRVAKFVKGLSLKERAVMPECDRKRTWRGEDEGMGNNNKPYCWDEFGPDSHWGQEVKKWAFIDTGSQPVKED